MIIIGYEIPAEEVHVVDFDSAATLFAPMDVEVSHLWHPAAGELEGRLDNAHVWEPELRLKSFDSLRAHCPRRVPGHNLFVGSAHVQEFQ